MLRSLSRAALTLGSFIVLSTSAYATSLCTIPNNVPLTVLPAGCDAILTNGPIYFNGVLDTGGDSHNIEIDSVDVFGLNTGTNSISAYITGSQTDTTNSTSSSFAGTNSNIFFQTTPSNDTIPADGSTNNFNIIHFIDNLNGGPAILKLNLGDNNGGHAAQTSTIVSSATSGAGTYLVSSTFTFFYEFSLNGGSSYTVASNDFVGTANGTGSIFQLETTTPEPASIALFLSGLAGLCFLRRRVL